MPEPTGATRQDGAMGTAIKLRVAGLPHNEETVCHWLITAPGYHPLWSQYLLAVVRLRDLDGFPPPKRQFLGATHELLVVTLNPERGPFDDTMPEKYAARGDLPYLVPINVALQFECTDREADALAELGAWAVVNGALEPESSNGPGRIPAEWTASMAKTLAHIRGEEHAP